jgi:LDH2 family malate/lactate/ureidoglycolate dehydrogenase
VTQAARENCIGFAFTNASKALPPHGGKRAFFGTSPIAFAAPTPPGKTFVADMAMSVTARGKIRYAAQRGEAIPAGVALDAEGRPTTDAAAAMEGVVLPMGAHKGAALSWMNDILAGVFTGASFGGETANPTKDLDRPQRTGHLFIAMRADLFMPLEAFQARMGELDDRVKAEPRAAGFDEIMSPGEPEARARAEREQTGLPLTADVIENMRLWGDKVGVPWPFD